MYTLRLLGGVSLEGDAGPLAGRAAQKRRLALLALVACAPNRTMSRDKVIGYLWPDSETEQARHLLSVALYELRRALGEEAVVSRGDDVHLDPARVSTDVEAFGRALESGDAAAAVERYTGAFLDGFFLSDAPEFERWVDGERTRWEQRYLQALEALAETRAGRGDATGAVEAWRRLAAHDPYNSRVAVRLMRALADAGDRAGALQHARIHATLLREEYGMEPDPEVSALEERLRQEPARPAPTAEPPATPPWTRDRDADASGSVASPNSPAEPALAGSADATEPEPRGSADAVGPGPAAPADATEPQPSGSRDAETPALRQPPHHASAPASAPASSFRRLRAPLRWAALFVLLISAAAIASWLGGGRGGRAASAHASVAVLPFADVSPDRGNEYFSDGLTDEITNALSRVDGLQVAARTSSFMFKGRAVDVREVGRQLNVGSVLEGSVRQSDDRLKITVRLVDVSSGFDLWSESYDRRMDDVFRVQDEIARSVAGALRVELVGGSGTPLVRSSTADLEAYHLYLRGRYYWYRRTAEDFGRAIQAFEQAIARDPTYALAYTGLADVYSLLASYDYGVLPPSVAMPRAKAAAARALEIDPGLAEAHAAIANIHLNYDWDWEAAERAFRRAVDLNPGYAPAHHWHSLSLVSQGRVEEARAAVRRARELDPLSLVMSTGLARHYYFTRDYPRSIEEYQRSIAMDSSFVTAHLGIGLAWVQLGRADRAIASYETALRLLRQRPPVVLALLAHGHARAGDAGRARELLAELEGRAAREYLPPEYIALVHLGLDDTDQALVWLERAYANRSGSLAFARVEPLLDPLRSDPRFQSLLARIFAA